jgi:muramoyltetrapeptide carboxypeptidase
MKPPRLLKGDVIGVISPAGPVNESDLQPGLNRLESAGFRVRLASHAYARRGYLAGEDAARLDELHDMFCDRVIKAIFCARGGYGSMRLLDNIRYDLIRENPKILVGYSDITALLMAVYKMTGLVSIHGPMVGEFSLGRLGNWESLLRLLSSSHRLVLNMSKGSGLVPGKATGILLGGNLSLICHLMGTPFLPPLDDCILFFEEKGEPLYRVDRMLTHLKLSGRLKGIAGIVAGQFEGCDDKAALEQLFLDRLSDLKIPLATGLPVGHGKDNRAVPLGLEAELDVDQMTLSVLDGCVE